MKFWYKQIFKYIYIQKTIRTNIRICLCQKNHTNKYPNIVVSKRWYKYMIQTNIRIRKFSNVRKYRFFMLGLRFDVRCWILDVIKLKSSWHNKGKVIFLYFNTCVNNLSHFTFGNFFSDIFLSKNNTNEYKKKDTNEYPNIFISKNDTNEYPNMFG